MSTPDTQDKKVPQFSSFTMRPATAPAESCCTDHACATESAPAAEALSDARYSWQVDGMDCAACARKVETAVRQVPGVSQVQVLFATEKLLVNAEGDVRAQVENAVRQAGYTLRDADAPAAEQTRGSLLRDNLPLLTLVIMMALSWGLEQANHPAGQLAFIATTLVGLWPVARQALRLIKSGSWFAIETLMSVAAIGALFIGATAEAAMVLLLFLIGERLEGWAASRARQGVSALMALKPDTAIRLRNGVRETVAQRDLRPGDVIEVAAGGRLPADGQLLSPFASFDESALTGESVPVERQAGERVAAGATSVDRLVQLTVISEPGDSAIDRILKLIEEAEERRAPIERFIDRFSRIYTPAIMVVALLVAIVPPLFFASAWLPWIYKGLTLLLIGCPCALVISTPAAITSGLAVAARRGALIKGGAALEQLGQVRQVAFDKTGTLTEGKPQVVAVKTFAGVDEHTALRLAAALEQGSSHPLARAILDKAADGPLPEVSGFRTLRGLGVSGEAEGHRLLLGNQALLNEQHINTAEVESEMTAQASRGATPVLLAVDGQAAALFAIRDPLREDSVDALARLHRQGYRLVMLTGDNPTTAKAIAKEAGIDEVIAGVLPDGKADAIKRLQSQGHKVAMVGDGINDAPALAQADVGIAMGGGSDVAIETAAITLMRHSLHGVADALAISKATLRNMKQNLLGAFVYNSLGIPIAAGILWPLTGTLLNPVVAGAAMALSSITVVSNANRLLRFKPKE